MKVFLVIFLVLVAVLVYGTIGAVYGVKIDRHWRLKCQHRASGKCDSECLHWYAGLLNGLFWPVSWALQIPMLVAFTLAKKPQYSKEEVRLADATTKLELQRQIARTEKELERYRGY